jgi:hypothetical protein
MEIDVQSVFFDIAAGVLPCLTMVLSIPGEVSVRLAAKLVGCDSAPGVRRSHPALLKLGGVFFCDRDCHAGPDSDHEATEEVVFGSSKVLNHSVQVPHSSPSWLEVLDRRN